MADLLCNNSPGGGVCAQADAHIKSAAKLEIRNSNDESNSNDQIRNEFRLIILAWTLLPVSNFRFRI
jgi:hypothetical protein